MALLTQLSFRLLVCEGTGSLFLSFLRSPLELERDVTFDHCLLFRSHYQITVSIIARYQI